MEININNIKALFKKVGHGSGSHSSWGHSPSRDWQIIAVCFLLALIGASTWSLMFFQGVSKGEIFLVEQKNLDTSGLLDREKLNAAMDRFDARQIKYDDLKLRAPSVGDPSI